MIHLPVVAPQAVATGSDMIRCPKMSATISASHCTTLQTTLAKPPPRGRGRLALEARQRRHRARICEGCPIGPIIAKRLAPGPEAA